MPIDINILRPEKGGDPEAVIKSENNRFKGREIVDETMKLDTKWRKTLFNIESLKKFINQYQKCVSNHMKNQNKRMDNEEDKTNEGENISPEKVEALRARLEECDMKDEEVNNVFPNAANLSFSSLTSILSVMKNYSIIMQEKLSHVSEQRETYLKKIGNVVHESVKVSRNEDENEVIKTWNLPASAQAVLEGKCEANAAEYYSPTGFKYLSHHVILQKIRGFDMKKGVELAGHRGYFLKGYGVLLNLALVNYGLNFLLKKGYTAMQPPYFLRKEVMEETAELKDFEESLYHIQSSHNAVGDANKSTNGGSKDSGATSSRDDLYMIATSEQPLCAFHRGETLQEKDLPIKYAGVSTCFRKEAGSHGKDTWGIFRVHQFEKVEQLCITTPDQSWAMHEEMTCISEEFYQSLGIPYRIISIVSGALNDAAAKKYDLEAWFPGYNDFKELVSCSNCTDYQSRALNIYMGYKSLNAIKNRPFVHLLNGTLVASERCLCCILENYQTATGVNVPEPLIPYVGTDFIPYVD